MEKKPIRPLVITIQKRFFQAFDELKRRGEIVSMNQFCDTYGLHKAKYSKVRNNPKEKKGYRLIDIDAPAYLVKDFGVSGDWMLTGKGDMFRNDKSDIDSYIRSWTDEIIKEKVK